MKSKSIFYIILTINFVFGSCSKEYDDTESFMKGYEIYSWEENSSWNYVITAGTNSVKTYESIVNSVVVYNGEEEFKTALNNFPKGEEFFWIGENWLESCWSEYYGNLSLPPNEIILEIKTYCKLNEINLSIAN